MTPTYRCPFCDGTEGLIFTRGLDSPVSCLACRIYKELKPKPREIEDFGEWKRYAEKREKLQADFRELTKLIKELGKK